MLHIFAGALCKGARGDCQCKVPRGQDNPSVLLFSIACHGLGGARSDAAGGHGFCPQWQKPQFAARTPHRGDAHNARLTPLHRGGERRGRLLPPTRHPVRLSCHPEPCVLSYVIPRREERPTRDLLVSDRKRGRSLPLPALCKGGCRAERGGRVVKERGICRQ